MSGPSTTRQGALVGCFTLIGVVILIAAIFTIGSMNDAFSRSIWISAVFQQVDGLKKGDSVWFSGVAVGTVRSVQFKPGPTVEIGMSLDADAAAFIASDVVAQVSSDGLIGNKIVVLVGGTSAADKLEDGDVLGVDVAVSMGQLMEEVKQTNDHLQVITERLANGEGTVGKLLTDDVLYDELTSTVTRLDSAAAGLSSFTRDLNRPGSLPQELMTDQTTWPKVKKVVDSLEVTSDKAAVTMDGLQASMDDPGTPVGVLLHDREAGTDLGGTFENLELSTKLLAEDLEAAQHNFLLRGFFRKKERAAEKEKKKAEKQER